MFHRCNCCCCVWCRSRSIANDVFGSESLKASDISNFAALHYFKTRRYEKALVHARKALEIRRAKLGDFSKQPPDARVADSYANVGLLLRLTGKQLTVRFGVLVLTDA